MFMFIRLSLLHGFAFTAPIGYHIELNHAFRPARYIARNYSRRNRGDGFYRAALPASAGSGRSGINVRTRFILPRCRHSAADNAIAAAAG